jgi:Na+-translocating ferredoxin:NAD+ oxidoreductase subunit B
MNMAMNCEQIYEKYKEKKMSDVYQRLAMHLDNLPASFPATDSGVELRILRRMFTPEEAEAALALRLVPESAADIANRLGRDEADVEAMYYRMSKKGLIWRHGNGPYQYMAAHFIAGIWEQHVNDLDEDLIHDVNAYIPQIWEKRWVKQNTQQLRVVPVSKSISVEMNVMPYEEAERIIKNQTAITVAPCICRKEQQMIGHGCGKPLETCLMLGVNAVFYEQNGLGRAISQEDALAILGQGVEAGLVLQPSNSQNPFVICMCCGCCCLVLKNLNKMDAPAKIANTNYYAMVEKKNCAGCGSCEDICQMNAITVMDESAVVDLYRCIGCGLCVTRCEFEAAFLVRKEESEWHDVPADTFAQFMRIARERGLG